MKLKHLFMLATFGIGILVAATSCGSDSNADEPAAPVVNNYVVTGSAELIKPCWVKLDGEVNYDGAIVEAGFELSPDATFKKVRRVGAQKISGKYSAEVKGILDQFTYYYRSYAVVDGTEYFGRSATFTTPELTYRISGKTFRMISIEDSPLGPVAVMQTEFVFGKDFEVSDVTFKKDLDGEGNVTKGIMRELMTYLRRVTGLGWRYPTHEEWLFAASGGSASKKYRFSGSNNLSNVGWFSGNCSSAQQPALKAANELGFYDMSGNFGELASTGMDSYILDGYYDSAALFNNAWSNARAYGGNWNSPESGCAVSSNESVPLLDRYQFDGNKYTVRFVYSRDPFYECWY